MFLLMLTGVFLVSFSLDSLCFLWSSFCGAFIFIFLWLSSLPGDAVWLVTRWRDRWGCWGGPLCCWLIGLAFLLTPHPQIITLTSGFGGSGGSGGRRTVAADRSSVECGSLDHSFILGFALPVGLTPWPQWRTVSLSLRLCSTPTGGEGEGLLSGLAPLTTHHDLRFQPGSSPQPTHTCCLWAPGPSSVPGGGLSATACCQDPDSSSLLFYRSAHTPASSVSWNLLKSLSHCCED